MKALTLWQPWASLIMVGAKPIEWRRWRAPSYVVGRTIVIHAGSRRVIMSEVEDLIDTIELDGLTATFGGYGSTGLDEDKALALLRPVLAGTLVLPTATGLGTARLGEPRQATDIAGGHSDSDRIDEAVWGWPVTDIAPFAEPIAIKGHQGFWNWPDARAAAGDFINEGELA